MSKEHMADLLKQKQEKIDQLKKERKLLMNILYKTKEKNRRLRERITSKDV